MVQLIAVGLIGGLGWYAYKAFQRQMASVGEELKKAKENKETKPGKAKNIDALEKGPDGVYRPRKSTDKNSD
ncbi:MAG: hypothetical protein WBD01_09025 [Salaquimonas sp.]